MHNISIQALQARATTLEAQVQELKMTVVPVATVIPNEHSTTTIVHEQATANSHHVKAESVGSQTVIHPVTA
eukprot:scaffold4869_cov59-Attheya_sp.AAC.1